MSLWQRRMELAARNAQRGDEVGYYSGYGGFRGFRGYGTPREVGYDLVGDDGPSNDMPMVKAQGQGYAPLGAPGPNLRVVPSYEGVARRLALPFNSPSGTPFVQVAGGTTVVLSLQPQRAIRIERLLIEQFPGVAMPSQQNPLLVVAFNVGAEPMLIAAGAMPCRAFASDAVGQVFRGYTAYPGITVTLSIQNPSADRWDFTGAIIGEAIGAAGF